MIYGDATGHDAHCRRCGSLLYSLVRNGAYVHVAMGTLLDDPSIRPTAHIFTGSKAPWYSITDDLPQYEGHVVPAERPSARGMNGRTEGLLPGRGTRRKKRRPANQSQPRPTNTWSSGCSGAIGTEADRDATHKGLP